MGDTKDDMETEENDDKNESSNLKSTESNMDDSKNDVENKEDLNAEDVTFDVDLDALDAELEKLKQFNAKQHDARDLENEENGDKNGYTDLNSTESKMDDSENDVENKGDCWDNGETSDLFSSTELSCDRCNTTFKGNSAKWNLRRHISSIHEGIRYPCKYEQCDKFFISDTSLQRHISSIHEGKRY